MKFTPAEIPDVILIEPDVFRDNRGFFLETYHLKKYEQYKIGPGFVQENHSMSVKGTLRGLHSQCKKPQGKLIRVIEGEVFDVVVDIRLGSPTFKKWMGINLSAESFKLLYVPPGFAHGFYVLGERAQMEYKCTDLYDPTDEISVLWNDPAIGIEWPVSAPLLSKKDAAAPPFESLMERFPKYNPSKK